MWLFRAAIVLFTINFVKCACPGVVSRKAWDAVSPVHVEYLVQPVSIVIIQHTVTPPCTTSTACVNRMQSIQNYHMDNLNYWDIASSFYVGGDGKIYEGTGWLHKGAHTFGYNSKSIGISFIGNYNTNVATDAQLDAVKELLRCGVEKGYLAQDFHVVGHRQLIATESPGRKLYNVIRRWPEWLEDVSSIKN
ncbi:peptidoglycan recognition protein-like [Epargyreus clarus]|uniref:peptidoglycan recognition protein-like n=1 Tax=Epargyreus clarus TaxID=520877 RepID=UPI003C2BBE41